MESADHQTLRSAVQWLEDGRGVWLATVARTWGSSPRPPGSLLALSDDGRLSGAVSGGCVETELLERLQRAPPAGIRILTFGVTAEESRRLGLPCGGRLELVIEPLTAAAPLRRLLEAMDERRVLRRRLCVDTGEASLHPPGSMPAFAYDGRNLDKLFGPQWRLLIIGSGQITDYLAALATGLDFQVIVCDPRVQHYEHHLPAGAALHARMPDEAVRELADDDRSAVVALTHEPNLDDMALMEALDSRAYYVGALGSRSNHAKRLRRLAALGVSQAGLQRLRGPVGLPIGSRRPAEIALAIAAELVAVRNGVEPGAARPPAAATAP